MSTVVNKEIEERISRHPCYSEEAHHHFARMHVAVAPACNIQCNYCNRKYDCANESRPGVVSEVLKPEEAVKKVLVVAGEIKQMSVVGIAGPGDPLANPEKTFATFKGVYEKAPDLKLCLSTNGLMLLDYVDEIKKQNIDHVTVTINAVDPEVGQHIYSWVFFKGKKYKGKEAAEILIERQLEGLEALTRNGILVKVNSVLIPGVNDEHLEVVAKEIKKRGAFLHNIMPLIVAPGTIFEKMGIKNPTPEEVGQTQHACSGGMKLMKHCRQCRADAVGLLGEDRSAEFTKDKFLEAPVSYDMEERQKFQAKIEEKMREKKAKRMERARKKLEQQQSTLPATRIALTTRGEARVNLHFGHAKEFLIFDVKDNDIKFVGVRKVQAYCFGKFNCSSDIHPVLSETAEILKDCQVLLTSGIGDSPKQFLEKKGLVCYVKSGNIEDLLFETNKFFNYTRPLQSCGR